MKYVGIKLIEAIPMTKEFHEEAPLLTITPGYQVTYENGYKSWSPKDAFDRAHIRVGDNNSIEPRNIDEFIKDYDVSQHGEKTTVVHAMLVNGFIITESSSCVDPKNFDMEIGADICKKKIQDQLWGLLGFMLQSAVKA